jgi:predicted NBD/HSP70 family sugar kinase
LDGTVFCKLTSKVAERSFRGKPVVDARNAGHLRRLNADRVLAVAMERTEPFTRTELMEATSLSAPTIGTLTSALIRRGLLRDLGAGPSRGGRRPAFMEFNARHGFVAAISMGATRTRVAVADLRGERVAHRVLPNPADLGPEELLTHLGKATLALLREARIRRERLLTVVAGAPGAVDRATGVVSALAPSLRGWSRVPMAEILGDILRVPIVTENDVNLAILGERWRGAARGHETCAFIHVGSGIGAGIMVGGELHRGHHSFAGEIGLMSMGLDCLARDYGGSGCLETLAGVRGAAGRWPPAEGGERRGWIEALFESAAAGDATARSAIDETGGLLGIAVANLSLVLDPSLVVMGGALFEQGGDFAGAIRKVVRRIDPSPPEIVVSALGHEAALWGCILVAANEARFLLRHAFGKPEGERRAAPENREQRNGFGEIP